MSTNDALFEVDSFIRKNIDKNYKVLGIFLDVHKAFDCVNHDILLEKLDRAGIRGVANNLLKSFLSGRTQRFKIDDTFSESLVISCGVPQGTVLGPLLFIIFINDLLNINTNINIELFSFADDTAILISDPTVNNIFYEANNILNTVYGWFCKNKLKLNLTKSKFIKFEILSSNVCTNNNLVVHSLNYLPNLTSTCSYNCIHLENVLEIKYLGLIMDYRLKWDRHIHFINNNLRKFFYTFKDTRYIFNNYYKRII